MFAAGRVKERCATDATAGLTLMGVRLYNPATGQFTTVDPIPGGNTTPYAYPQDPITTYDLNGMWWSWINSAASGIKNAGKAVVRGTKAAVRGARYIAGHVTLGINFCAGACIGLGFQSGHVSASIGAIGFGGFAPQIGWNSATPQQQSAFAAQACLAGAIGGCITAGKRSKKGAWYGIAATGGAGVSIGGSYSILDWDVLHPRRSRVFGGGGVR